MDALRMRRGRLKVVAFADGLTRSSYLFEPSIVPSVGSSRSGMTVRSASESACDTPNDPARAPTTLG